LIGVKVVCRLRISADSDANTTLSMSAGAGGEILRDGACVMIIDHHYKFLENLSKDKYLDG
jgi:hypothetical protein